MLFKEEVCFAVEKNFTTTAQSFRYPTIATASAGSIASHRLISDSRRSTPISVKVEYDKHNAHGCRVGLTPLHEAPADYILETFSLEPENLSFTETFPWTRIK
jgi:hypothetical protein